MWGLFKALPTVMAAVIYACLCPLGFYFHISSLSAAVRPFPHMMGVFPALLCCTGIIVIGIPPPKKNTLLYMELGIFLH